MKRYELKEIIKESQAPYCLDWSIVFDLIEQGAEGKENLKSRELFVSRYIEEFIRHKPILDSTGRKRDCLEQVCILTDILEAFENKLTEAEIRKKVKAKEKYSREAIL